MSKIIEHLEEANIRFAGDSGDGMQLVGTQFSDTSGFAGNEVNTFPGSLADYTVYAINMAREIKSQLSDIDVPAKILAKTKNIFALGITYWLFNRPLEPTVE